MGRVAGVFDNPPGFPCTPPGVDILKGGKLTSNNVAGGSYYYQCLKQVFVFNIFMVTIFCLFVFVCVCGILLK